MHALLDVDDLSHATIGETRNGSCCLLGRKLALLA
jgi:hypothetical protein